MNLMLLNENGIQWWHTGYPTPGKVRDHISGSLTCFQVIEFHLGIIPVIGNIQRKCQSIDRKTNFIQQVLGTCFQAEDLFHREPQSSLSACPSHSRQYQLEVQAQTMAQSRNLLIVPQSFTMCSANTDNQYYISSPEQVSQVEMGRSWYSNA